MPVIKIDPKDKYPRIYWPEDLKRLGYVGQIEVLYDNFTAILIHPGATPEQIRGSLENRIRDIELRSTAEPVVVRPQEAPSIQEPSQEAPIVEWITIQCPYPDCNTYLQVHMSWESAVCGRCQRGIRW